MTVRVFLVDDHEVVRRGLRDLIEEEPDFEVVGEAGTAAEAIERVAAARADVAVIDVRLPDRNGVLLCRELRSLDPGPIPLVLTSFEDEDAMLAAVMAGAAGYVLKQINGAELLDAIRKVAAGHSLIDASGAQRVVERRRQSDRQGMLNLSPQERRILGFVAEGYTNRQIATEMFLSERTVKNYVSKLLHKLGMSRRTEAAVYATRLHQQGW